MVSQRTIFVFLCVIVGDLAVYYDTMWFKGLFIQI